MTLALTASISDEIAWEQDNTVEDGTVIPDANADSLEIDLAAGTGASGTADLKWSATLTINASGNVLIDLTNLPDNFGNTQNMARVKFLSLRQVDTTENADSLGGPCLVGAAGSNPWTGIISSGTATLPLGTTAGSAGLLKFAVYDATAFPVSGSSKILNIANTSGAQAVVVRVVIVGSST